MSPPGELGGDEPGHELNIDVVLLERRSISRDAIASSEGSALWRILTAWKRRA